MFAYKSRLINVFCNVLLCVYEALLSACPLFFDMPHQRGNCNQDSHACQIPLGKKIQIALHCQTFQCTIGMRKPFLHHSILTLTFLIDKGLRHYYHGRTWHLILIQYLSEPVVSFSHVFFVEMKKG